MPQARLKALRRLLAAFIDRPEQRALVVGCTDPEMFYLVHTLLRMDEESRADRFLVIADPFISAKQYADIIDAALASSAGPALPSATIVGPTEVAGRLERLFVHLLADLPTGDHRLICALLPAEIHDPAGFAAVAEMLMCSSLDPRLRLVLRDDIRAPRHFTVAAEDPSERLLAYRFSLPPAVVMADVTAAAYDPARSPDERAQALLQVACEHLARREYSAAVTCCDTAVRIAKTPAIRHLALALQADTYRHSGDGERARTTGALAIQLATAAGDRPVVIHAAMALGELSQESGLVNEARKCFTLAERAALPDSPAQARARDARIALENSSC